ncbi:glycosyltransferase family 4 protein [Corynebacterium aquatimens]|uniref:Phosphatidylinositol alpha-mannosyltransferase n=1 Tax=Corynebacterium aquatimens TaxID=1190508 RepID=A0A931DZ57_9CORY|nr:glycosyltransferase family 4 protein [Corynebacterium aquatimens]MBG6121729.1 phosphatidylinositol alpha-mannosyltransferase [Corynebacterium aquatimens]WJY65732.1 GDP-mannose-dependent alpha-(1-2)-phosphatidylinositol mannosyltransferase [Corynebacterium aquatimens]
MRIAIVCPYSFDYPGGVQAHCIDLAQALRECGHDARVIGPGTASTKDSVPDFVTLGGGSVAVPYNGSVARIAFGPRTLKTVKKFLSEGDFDIVHIHEPNSPSYSLAALITASVPVVATYHTSAEASRLLKIARPFLRLALEKIYAGICVSETARRWQVEQLGGDPVLIPNGVDVGFYASGHAEPSPAHEKHVPEIVFLGRLDEPRKGFEVFARALGVLRERGIEPGKDLRVTVAGGGLAVPHADSPALQGVEFVGRISDEEKAELFRRADIYVAPNTGGESFGIVLIEAMAAGCAVIASDIEAFRTVGATSREHPAARVFPVGDAQRLADAIEELLGNESIRASLAAAGQARAQEYDWGVVVKQVLDVYEVVAGEKR